MLGFLSRWAHLKINQSNVFQTNVGKWLHVHPYTSLITQNTTCSNNNISSLLPTYNKNIAITTITTTTTTAQKTMGANYNHNNRHLWRRQMGSHAGGFSLPGPQNLNEILKTELIKGKTKTEVSDIWMTYHESRSDVHGTIMNAEDAKTILPRAKMYPFFITPVFREDGYFMLLSQFQSPSHFFLAYLEDYKLDPSSSQPLITFSIFSDLEHTHDGLSLLRCDIVNKGIGADEGLTVMQHILDSYRDSKEFERVRGFNEEPGSFDVDDYISCMNQKWKERS
mmetsp:Transcript_14356/g.20497  ORF Transcript_14356/g.20497 Transcript_14356/m.20497 type:complete len:281 (+) Transcript_14356:30-872(+)